MNNQLNDDLAAYRLLSSETEKQAFLAIQKAKIARMTHQERIDHQKAIQHKVAEIAQRVEDVHQLS